MTSSCCCGGSEPCSCCTAMRRCASALSFDSRAVTRRTSPTPGRIHSTSPSPAAGRDSARTTAAAAAASSSPRFCRTVYGWGGAGCGRHSSGRCCCEKHTARTTLNICRIQCTHHSTAQHSTAQSTAQSTARMAQISHMAFPGTLWTQDGYAPGW